MAPACKASFYKLFGSLKKMVAIGVIHVRPLPGTPLHQFAMKDLVRFAIEEAEIYKSANVDGIIVENMWDVPYVKASCIGPEIASSMTRIATEVKKILPDIPCGVQVLAGCNREAMAVSKAAELDFIRAEGFVFGHVADEGWIDATAGELLRFRKQIGCENVQIFADIKKKHSAHAVTSDVSVAETAKAAEFFLADGLILTGTATGVEADPVELKSVSTASNLPVLIGSGITPDNLRKFQEADGVIVGSYFKKSGKWHQSLDSERVHSFMKEVWKLRDEISSNTGSHKG